jgi:GAF domain-containing protein
MGSDLDTLLPELVGGALARFNADVGVMFLMDGKGALQQRVMKARDGLTPTTVELTKSVVDQVVAAKEGVLAMESIPSSPTARAPETRTTMAVPLLLGDEVLGVLYLDSKSATYTEHDLKQVVDIANQAAEAIRASRLTEVSG